MNIRNLSCGLIALLWMSIGLSGCGLLQNQKNPEAWFKQTLAGLAGKDTFSFNGEAAVRTQSQKGFKESMAYEGSLTEHDKLTIRSMLPAEASEVKTTKPMKIKDMHAAEAGFRRQDGHWVHLFSEGNTTLNSSLARFNPLAQLDAISRLPKQMREASGGARGTKVLRIELEPAAARQWLSEQLQGEMDMIRQKTIAENKGRSPQEMRQLSDVWNRGDTQLKQMLDHSEVAMIYYLTIDKKTGFPVKLSSESGIRYMNLHQQEQQETLVNDVSFHP
ncbi:hypothetical protein GRF59_16145 [Paenibacillus sp. HJL G12]|uniref:Lipoprotein n=1 Tax=Paenibacillus dendrobii TaxID=2691084 RepID=A0A7X3LHH6_9BACL|nr:hypothetical protein [Paenibacillus dendrobii]MWV45157.1 hypothetical protein [Paenibacillus dendrobii]